MKTSQPDAPLRISVVMPAYNAAHLLPTVLAPLIEMHRAGAVDEILVVDDRSTDTTAEVARSHGVRVIVAEKNGGPGAVRNLAALHAVGDILWFVDSDVVAHKGGAEKIQTAFAEPGVVAVFGSYDAEPSGQSWISKYKNLIHRYYHQRAHHESSTFWAGCGAVLKSAFLNVGGFDIETYTRPSIEDIDLGYRLRQAGGRILLQPDLLGKHLKVWTFSSVIKTDIFLRAIPWSRLLITREGLTDDLNVSKGERLRAGCAWLLLFSLLALPFAPSLLPVTLGVLALCFALNIPLFRFMRENGGIGFAIFAMLYQQVYYLYSSAAFVYCLSEARFASRQIRLQGA